MQIIWHVESEIVTCRNLYFQTCIPELIKRDEHASRSCLEQELSESELQLAGAKFSWHSYGRL